MLIEINAVSYSGFLLSLFENIYGCVITPYILLPGHNTRVCCSPCHTTSFIPELIQFF